MHKEEVLDKSKKGKNIDRIVKINNVFGHMCLDTLVTSILMSSVTLTVTPGKHTLNLCQIDI